MLQKGCPQKQRLASFFPRAVTVGFPPNTRHEWERLLDRLDAAVKPEDMDLPGYRVHPLKGDRQGGYAVLVSGNWRLAFRFNGEDATDVDLEDYH
ncbi:MAG: type II toxin-antitoxin system RelE/ParE family toxin [Zoogloeaceae bacterium]|nr:type II toxin-antitoxin system RelE/ParE family toxin [Zoogloeaceae bacterium]